MLPTAEGEILRSPPSKQPRIDVRDITNVNETACSHLKSAEKDSILKSKMKITSGQSLSEEQMLKEMEQLDIPFCNDVPTTSSINIIPANPSGNRRKSSLGRGRRSVYQSSDIAPSKAAEIILPTPISQYQTQLLVEINGKISHYEDYKTLLEREIGVWKSLLFDQKSLADEAESSANKPLDKGKYKLDETTFLRQRPDYERLRNSLKEKAELVKSSAVALEKHRRKTDSALFDSRIKLEEMNSRVIQDIISKESYGELLECW